MKNVHPRPPFSDKLARKMNRRHNAKLEREATAPVQKPQYMSLSLKLKPGLPAISHDGETISYFDMAAFMLSRMVAGMALGFTRQVKSTILVDTMTYDAKSGVARIFAKA